MSLRSPLGRVLGAGSAKDGTGHWWSQRVTAVALLILGVWFLLSLTQVAGFARPEVIAWIGRPWNAVMLLLLIAALAWHSSLGVQVVIEDYVHASFAKITMLLANRFGHVFVAVAAVLAVVRISLGDFS
jgi:succinate dehydrogenase / fumarate reductase membrane anchor subunit